MRAHSNLRGWVATDVCDPIGVGSAIASFGAQIRGPGHRPSRRQGV